MKVVKPSEQFDVFDIILLVDTHYNQKFDAKDTTFPHKMCSRYFVVCHLWPLQQSRRNISRLLRLSSRCTIAPMST